VRSLAPLIAAPLLAALLTACCPRTSPPPTAFTAHLRPLGNGLVEADLVGGGHLTLTGVHTVPDGLVYVRGELLASGRVAVTDVTRLSRAAGG